MNKNNKTAKNVSAPYRNLSLNKTAAPVKVQGDPRNRVIKSSGDLRAKGGK